MNALSAVVITLNAERGLEDCLRSVAFADDILVVDSGSTDRTLAIAAGCGARIIHQEWLGYGAQKSFAADRAEHDWILSIDADEQVTDELRQAIVALLREPRRCAYRMPRRNRFMGRWLRHGEGYPDYSVRLFDRRQARWSDDPVHEKVVCPSAPGLLRGDLLHASEEGLADYIRKQNGYTTLQARALYQAGTRSTVSRTVFSPCLRFFKFYFFRLGFLDGLPGFVHIAIGCFNSFLKYAKLRELQAGGDVPRSQSGL